MVSAKLTITLTGRRPVSVDKVSWPIIASARDWDGALECQANRRWTLTVRQHGDGRSIVYGVYTSQWQGARDLRGGELVSAGADIPAAIQRVTGYIDASTGLADACIADLPAEIL